MTTITQIEWSAAVATTKNKYPFINALYVACDYMTGIIGTLLTIILLVKLNGWLWVIPLGVWGAAILGRTWLNVLLTHLLAAETQGVINETAQIAVKDFRFRSLLVTTLLLAMPFLAYLFTLNVPS